MGLKLLAIFFGATVLGAQGADPRPQSAATAILSAFDRYDVVGMNAAHSDEKQDAFVMALVRQPAFPEKVNDIVVECGNSSDQATLDRYIAGDAVSIEEARQVWRQTSIRMCALSGFYADFFPAIRRLNQGLAKEKRLRVLVTEPAAGTDRNSSIASIVTTEVLAKHRKALVLCGVGHLFHGDAGGSAVAAYEKTYPGRTFVVDTHKGFAAEFDLPRGRELEARMRTWPAPALVSVRGSWLAGLDLPYFLWPFPKRMAGESFADLVDAYLYLGPGSELTYERTPDSILNDAAYLTEISRRVGPVNVDALKKRNDERALFTAADVAEARHFAPGAEYVGAYASRAGDPPAIDIDFRGGALAARMDGSDSWTPLASAGDPARFTVAIGTETATLEFNAQAGSEMRVTLDRGATRKTTLVRF